MKIRITNEDLRRALSSVLPFSKPIGHVGAYGVIKVTAKDGWLSMYAFDYMSDARVRVEATVEEEGEFCFVAKSLSDKANSLETDETVTIETSAGKAIVSTSSVEFSLQQPVEPEHYPTMKSAEDEGDYSEVKLMDFQLKTLIKLAAHAVSKEKTAQQVLRGVYLFEEGGVLWAASADGFRLSEVKTDIPVTQNFSAAVMPSALVAAAKASDGQVTMRFSQSKMQIGSSDVVFSTPLIDAKFPEYRAAIPTLEPDRVMTINAQQVSKSLKQALTVDTVSSGNIAVMELDNNSVVMMSKGESENTEIDMDMSSPVNVRIGVNKQMLKNTIDNMTEDVLLLQITGPQSPIMIIQESAWKTTAVIMPMNPEGGL